LNEILITLGSEDVRLKKYGSKEEVDKDLLKSVLDTLAQLTRFTSTLEGHGGKFKDLLAESNKGHLPEFMVRIRIGNEEELHYFDTEKEILAYAHENRDLGLFEEELTEEEEAEYKEKFNGVQRRAVKRELHESAAIAKVLARLKEFGLKTEPFFSEDDKPLYELIEGNGEDSERLPVFNLFEILDRVLEIGRKGMRIQRFKGLGEMNAKELYSTTMDPETRQLLQVRLDDENSLEADKMFDVLMGDIVEPRKRFIEDNALNVQNLDV